MSDIDNGSRAGTIDYSAIGINIDDAKPVERPFLGTVTQDTYEEGRVYGPGDSGITLHLVVTPLGRDKGFHAWLPLKYAKDSEDKTLFLDGLDGRETKYSLAGALGRVMDSFRLIFGAKDSEGQARQPGHGQLNGLTGWFVQRVLTYGKDPVTGELRGAGGRPTLMAVRKATAQEIAEAGGEAPSQSTTVYLDADITAALDILSGKKPIQFQRDVMKSTLAADIKSDILQGKMAAFLVANGYATEAAGVITRVADSALVAV